MKVGGVLCVWGGVGHGTGDCACTMMGPGHAIFMLVICNNGLLGMPPAADPACTHIVYPFGPKGDPDDGHEYMRVLGVK